jgi:hypothetical protein
MAKNDRHEVQIYQLRAVRGITRLIWKRLLVRSDSTVARSRNYPCDRNRPSSFLADSMGAKVAEAAEDVDAVLTATFDLEALAELGNNWFVFRDRRPDLYGSLVTLDGRSS